MLLVSGAVEDILLVPVGISYDVLIERNFVRHELMVSCICRGNVCKCKCVYMYTCECMYMCEYMCKCMYTCVHVHV